MAKHTYRKRSNHGLTRSPTYRSWQSMLSRCLNQNDDNFEYYGGRGIKICAAWQESFASFLKDMGERPAGLSLDRKETDGDYTPGNCRWATTQEQALNRRSNVRITHAGVSQTATEWASATGKSRNTIYHRVGAGWSAEEIITKPAGTRVGRPATMYTFEGDTLNLLQWATRTQIPVHCLKKRILKYGWSVERALTTPVDKTRHTSAQKVSARVSKLSYV